MSLLGTVRMLEVRASEVVVGLTLLGAALSTLEILLGRGAFATAGALAAAEALVGTGALAGVLLGVLLATLAELWTAVLAGVFAGVLLSVFSLVIGVAVISVDTGF